MSLLAIRRCSSGAALMLMAACGARKPTHDSKASGGQAHTPAEYSVEDFYKNSQFRGAAWSADGRKILVSSNLSGIWNAYAVPASGGAPQALTQATTNSGTLTASASGRSRVTNATLHG